MTEKRYTCSCWADYPNKAKKKSNGKWICKDNYDFVEVSKNGCTHCKKKEAGTDINVLNNNRKRKR